MLVALVGVMGLSSCLKDKAEEPEPEKPGWIFVEDGIWLSEDGKYYMVERPSSRGLSGWKLAIPTDRVYSMEHTWLQTDGQWVDIGITPMYNEIVGSIVCFGCHVEMGLGNFAAGDCFGYIDGVKGVQNVYFPILTDQIYIINQDVLDDAGTVFNSWAKLYANELITVRKIGDPLSGCLTAANYAKYIKDL